MGVGVKQLMLNKLQFGGKGKIDTQKTISKIGEIIFKIITFILLVGLVYLIIQPWLILIFRAFMDMKDIYNGEVFVIPRNPTFYSIAYVWELLDYSKGFFSSLWYAVSITVLQLISCLLVAYGFSRFNFRFKGILFSFVILTIIVPPTSVILNQYIFFSTFDLFGLFKLLGFKPIDMTKGYWVIMLQAITCMGTKNGILIYLLKNMLDRVPVETQDAAKVDGANTFVTFYKIMVPAVANGVVSCILLMFVWSWNDKFLRAWFGSGKNILIFKVANVHNILADVHHAGHAADAMEWTTQIGILLTNIANFLYVLPLIVLFVFTQKHFVEGIERSGLVG